MKLRKAMVVAALLLGSSLTHAATIFSDNFDTYVPDQLNWLPPAASGWVVTDGTIDLHGAGGSYDVLPGNGSYVDLDGSSLDSGLFSKNLNLIGGETTGFPSTWRQPTRKPQRNGGSQLRQYYVIIRYQQYRLILDLYARIYAWQRWRL